MTSDEGTEIVPLSTEIQACKALAKRVSIRTMDGDAWIEKHGSGTLRKNKRIGMSYRDQYLKERVAYEFGYGFEILPRTRVEWGVAITEGDCHAVTEAGWHIERYLEMSIFPEDYFECKHISVSTEMGKRSGIGIICRQTSAPWIPAGYRVFAIVAQVDKTDHYLPAVNPF